MSHDASKVVLGGNLFSGKVVRNFEGDPATFKAGLCVRYSSTGVLSLTSGYKAGISLGKSLSNTKRTAVARKGLAVPILAHLKRASGTVTITSYANLVSGTSDSLSVGGQAFTFQAGAATPGAATVQAATSNNATATSLAAQINAHVATAAKVFAVASGAVVTIYSVVDGAGSTGTGNDIAVAYTNNDANVGLTLAGLTGGKLSGGSDSISGVDYGTQGTKVYINDTTGKADVASGLSTVSDATYASNEFSGVKTGIQEDGTEAACLLIDMPGGL